MRERPTEPQQRFAVIDIGTNTFHLLIAEPGKNGRPLWEIYRSRHFIKLAEKGIETLSTEALTRGMNALLFFRQQIDLHKVPADQVIALGTAALRTATNGPAFQTEVRERTNIHIQIITGDREAQLIAQGALMAIPRPQEKVLIMDIGGGSVEFIIADEGRVYWAQSFPVGVAVLYRKFQHNEPISPEEVDQVRAFLSLQLQPLLAALQSFPTTHLIGAAGTFDVVADHLAFDKRDAATHAFIDLDLYEDFYQKILATTQQQRYDMPEIPNDRADMIVVALILIDLILQLVNIRQLTVSYYAMKEGMMAELIRIRNEKED
ncbi:Ppx/GppA phosphatase family protein [Flavilitoribacter nigricans]|uniref:Ppx/GppA phosphatase N-terminal domain-containing protein n=1 Tax=Flavilitoribacter nigricans (strain ATCC 23147 / DSM 23189 / NBRC 102662 / NCIMB 1420 / SS-2) TaxID=1122177 RepID=A0A2D0N9M5_FLAN2|nr:hypothetical protein [Flavilitoribacter nigricans]PHN04483.1 hypothetical protein CRP01_20965 [Flavilitoribacter nigricans DSM 23189 = NBRC 102662]